ncbi:hypothetical protein IB276_33710 [Ensifer sp. ENS04]|uniref:hypothetical protein n=2 Tax=Ensifer TaxID=106591 RepID=UPI000B5B5209|nr:MULTISPECIES: hypothetical protein [unclassified Ensifer]MBD9544400.1 hypothetical protein [Ensifer sp. ENS04]OWZ90810.1 hypothetical protein B9J07_26395 [Sinorhizobium sp. LM21]
MATTIMAPYPNLPVVLATGYADVERIGATSRFRPLAKPYARRPLAEALSATAVKVETLPACGFCETTTI